MIIAGLAFDTSGGAGPRWHPSPVSSTEGFIARHPPRLLSCTQRSPAPGTVGRWRPRRAQPISSGSWSALLEVERFEPPAEFRERALLDDPAVYEEAAADPEAWWLRQATELLDWVEEPSEGLDESNPPFYKWFADGRLNASANCLDRHVEAGLGDRVAYHWRGEEGEERDITYAELLADVQRFANALRDRGIEKGDVVGIYLPMIPEVVVAMLACARIGAVHNVVFGGFSAEAVRERMEFSEAKALVTVDGARRKGRTAPIKAQVDEADGRAVDSLETIVVVRHTGDRVRDARGPRRLLLRRADGGRRPELPAGADGRRAPALHPLHLRLDREAEGDPAHHRRLPDRRRRTHRYVFDLKPEEDVYWCAADVGWVTGHSYIVYGPLANGATSVMYEGAPDYPAQGRLVGDRRALRRDDPLHGADRDPRLHEVGRRSIPAEHDLSSLRLLGSRSASRSTRRRGSGTTR